MIRVLVCGGRDYENYEAVKRQLDRLHQRIGVLQIIHGDATGADRLAGRWADENGVETDVYPIEKGESGFDRNTRMLAYSHPDLVMPFPGGRGTKDMTRKAHMDNRPVLGGLDFTNGFQTMDLFTGRET